MEKLLEEIIYCENIKKCKNGDLPHPCSKIVSNQGGDLNDFSLPEPWNGDIINAEILFISSNPSIDEEEEFPTFVWEKEKSIDFFVNRFNGVIQKWVNEDKYVLLKNGAFRKNPVKFWSSVKKRAEEIIPNRGLVFGVDFAITEIVKCKSKNEIGVKEALDECLDKFFLKTLDLSNAKILIVLGKPAKLSFCSYFQLSENSYLVENFEINGKTRDIIFLPHPSSFEKIKTVEKLIGTEKLSLLRTKYNSAI